MKIHSYILSFNPSNHQAVRTKSNVPNSLAARQQIVGGSIAIYSLTDNIDIIYCEDYASIDKQNAWMIYDKHGNEQLIIYGTILCMRYQNNEYASLNPCDYNIINSLITPISIFSSESKKNGKHITYKTI